MRKFRTPLISGSIKLNLRIHDDTFDKTMAIDRRMLDGFTAEETAELFAYLDRVQNNIDKMEGRERNL